MDDIKINVGTDFSVQQLEAFLEYNVNSSYKIESVYGSVPESEIAIPSARPDYRLKMSNINKLKHFTRIALDNNIEVEYAANALITESIEVLYSKKQSIIDQFRYLESIGVKTVILSNPIFMELVSLFTHLKIKVSTILSVNNINAIKYYAQYNVSKICPDIYINRNLPLLRAIQNEANTYGIDIELLTNEVCLFGDAPCDNILRTNCYIQSGLGGNQKERFSNWPYDRCQCARAAHPESILKIPFILPIHLDLYNELTGISHFKVSGRTNSNEYLLNIVKKYQNKTFEGSIESLFMLPQNTIPNSNERITVDVLNKYHFFESLFNKKDGCNYNCYKCHLCEQVYERICNSEESNE